MPLELKLAIPGSSPARAIAAHVDVCERSMPATCGIDADSSDERRMTSLNGLSRLRKPLGVPDRHAAIPRDVIRIAVAVVVDINIGRVAVHVTAEVGAAGRVPSTVVVTRRAKAA